ncbi:MAG TPA: M28 family peptidase [Flavobacteriales bacterium]|nr:M28 family peptidase [Flavobacteriales bacterium]HPH82525.1 M28 family peptidase [Flavobacteriales bacterium]
MKNKWLGASLLLMAGIWTSCGGPSSSGDQPVPTETPKQAKLVPADLPAFNADTAYAITAKQVAFGPRVPNTEAHVKCADYLIATLKRYGAEVVVQSGKVTAYTGESLSMRNILARVNPSTSTRIMLCAHWDTRPFSDQDIMKPKARFDGAVDGAASVGILLEIARVLQAHPAPIGVDIVLFDAEDYGNPKESNTYCLGSQYFATNPPIPNFSPKYGILLDMVGASGATFYREGFSMQYAPDVMNRVWSIGAELGYSSYFRNDPCGSVTDDHYFVNTILGIPTIDIIHHDPQKGFGDYWHTQQDNMNAVDKTTLGVVGKTLLGVVYSEKSGI